MTVDGAAHAVGSPFMVVATQNPVDYEGTFPLPESQMDRFLMRLHMGYPQPGDELEILRAPRLGYDAIALDPVATRTDVLRLQALAAKVFVEDSVLDYVLKIVTATRTEAEFRAGISVRGGLALRAAAQARALLLGRDFVVPGDVQEMVGAVFAHRRRPRPRPHPVRADRRQGGVHHQGPEAAPHRQHRRRAVSAAMWIARNPASAGFFVCSRIASPSFHRTLHNHAHETRRRS